MSIRNLFPLLIAFTLQQAIVNGQIIKTYQGPYGGNFLGTTITGQATYQYYENENNERIFNGDFSFNSKNGDYYHHITGHFKNGLRNGQWKIACKISGWRGVLYIIVVTGEYNNGDLNGVFTYECTEAKNNKVFATSKAHFKNNLLVGHYEYISSDEDNRFKIEYTLDSNGLYNGAFKVKYEKDGVPYKDSIQYSHGNVSSRLYRNMSTGEILSKDTVISSTDYRPNWNLYTAINFWIGDNKSGNSGTGNGNNPLYANDIAPGLKITQGVRNK